MCTRTALQYFRHFPVADVRAVYCRPCCLTRMFALPVKRVISQERNSVTLTLLTTAVYHERDGRFPVSNTREFKCARLIYHTRTIVRLRVCSSGSRYEMDTPEVGVQCTHRREANIDSTDTCRAQHYLTFGQSHGEYGAFGICSRKKKSLLLPPPLLPTPRTTLMVMCAARRVRV